MAVLIGCRRDLDPTVVRYLCGARKPFLPVHPPARDASEPIDIRAVCGCLRCPLPTGARGLTGVTPNAGP